MLIKSISHSQKKSAELLIKYIFDNRKSLRDTNGDRLIFKQHLRSFDQDKWSKQFRDLETKRQSHYGNRSVVCYHEVISFSPKSTKYLSRAILKDLVSRYIKLRTDGKQLCIGAIHFDKGKNWHAHLVFSGIRTTDYKSARISKSKMASIKQELQAFQIKTYPLLSDSIVRNGLKKKD